MKFVIKADKFLTVGAVIKNYSAGDYETENETEIAALKGAKGVSFEEVEESKPLTEEGQLGALQAEYEAKFGKKPHHKAGIDKLKEDLDAFDSKQGE